MTEKKRLHHIIATQQFDKSWLEKFFKEVERIEKIYERNPLILKEVLRGKNIVLLFWEVSPRTRSVFYLSALRLGAGVEVIEGAKKENEKWELGFSSRIKGVLFEDIIRTFASYYDVLVIRHYKEGAVFRAVKVLEEFNYSTAVINAGGGSGRDQHPLQALVDFYTIKKEFGQIDGISVAFLGNLFYSRVVHSLVYLLSKFKVSMYFISPSHLKMPPDIINHLISQGINFEEIDDSNIGKVKVDMWYIVRVEKKDFRREKDYLTVKDNYVIDKRFLTRLAIAERDKIFHPFPRIDEIPAWQIGDQEIQDRSIDKLPQAGYFHQIKNGPFVAMTLLKMILAPDLDLRMLSELWERKIKIIAQCVVCGRVKCNEIGWAEKPVSEISGLPKTVCPRCSPKK
jgi:aspartate carbamoyltransferase catalytic subunit